MKIVIPKGATSRILTVFIQASNVTTGAGLSGLTHTSSIVGGYVREGGTGVALAVDEDVTTEGTYQAPSAAGKVRIGTSANMRAGTYELHFHNDLWATGAEAVVITLGGASNMADLAIEVQLSDPVRGLGSPTALPNAAADAAGGLPISDAGGLDLDTQLGKLVGTLATGTHQPQTGDAFARLGAPAGASTAADIAAVKAETATIVADTNELQTDWANGGRLDLILDARASQSSVDTIDGIVDAILLDTGTDGVVVAAGSKTGYSLTATTGLGNQTANITGSITSVTNGVTLAAGVTHGGTGTRLVLQTDSATDYALDIRNPHVDGVAFFVEGGATGARWNGGNVGFLVNGSGYGMMFAGSTSSIHLNSAVSGGAGITTSNTGNVCNIDITGNITGNLSGSVGSVTGGVTLADDAITAAVMAISAIEEIRNAITGGAYDLDTDANGRIRIVDGTGAGELDTSAGRVIANIVSVGGNDTALANLLSYLDGSEFMPVDSFKQNFAVSGTTLTVKKPDTTTTAYTKTLATTSSADDITASTLD